MTAEADQAHLHDGTQSVTVPSARAVVGGLAGLSAAWLAAGSTGLLAHPLRHALAWVALAVAAIACWPPRQTCKERWLLIGTLLAAAAMMVPATPVHNVLAAAVLLAMLARAHVGPDRRVLLVTSVSVAVLAVYLLACTSIAAVWSITDALGRMLGELGAWISGRPLWVGATFAGLDFLVLMGALYVGWLVSTRAPRLRRAVYAAVAIAGGHLAYLVLLSYAMDLHGALPAAPPLPESGDYIPPPWVWSDAARSLLPWNLPLAAGVIQLVVAAMMLRWAAWLPGAAETVQSRDAAQDRPKTQAAKRSQPKREKKHGDRRQAEKNHQTAIPTDWRGLAVTWGPLILAALLALLTNLAPGQSSLEGKKIVASNQGYLDWQRPVHDSYGEMSAGLYGMLPEFVASLGGGLEASDALRQEDLDDADVVLLIHPAGPWAEDQLQRIRQFVLGGGSLLVLADTPIQQGEMASSYNDVLRSVLGPEGGIEVLFDCATSVTWNWQDSYTAMAHPVVMGVEDGRNRYGMASGPSLRIRWPAQPLLLGRWGWSDPGIDSVLTRVSHYDAGERLGDVVLAAERRLGRGTVVVLPNAPCVSNQGNVNSYVFTGRLLAYLAGNAASPQAAWRQAIGLLACLALTVLLVVRLDPAQVAAVAIVLSLVLGSARTFTQVSMRVLPEGREHSAFNVAYVDASHLEAYADTGWGFEGIAGLTLTLMRNGYQPFLLPELTGERLERAGMLISIAPARPFSQTERQTVRRFVERGGIYVCMVGADRAPPVQSLLDQFELGVPRVPVRPGEKGVEPRPMSHFTTLYRALGADYDSGLLIYTGWPVECEKDDRLVIGFENLPIIALREVGRGKVVLIGDTAFAMNKNLEYVGGEPFNGRYDNAHFWRWLITYLTDQEDWLPPPKERSGSQPSSDRAVGSGDQSESNPVDPTDRGAMNASASPDTPDRPGDQAGPPRSAPFGSLPIEEVAP
jgi:hypothetical protein